MNKEKQWKLAKNINETFSVFEFLLKDEEKAYFKSLVEKAEKSGKVHDSKELYQTIYTLLLRMNHSRGDELEDKSYNKKWQQKYCRWVNGETVALRDAANNLDSRFDKLFEDGDYWDTIGVLALMGFTIPLAALGLAIGAAQYVVEAPLALASKLSPSNRKDREALPTAIALLKQITKTLPPQEVIAMGHGDSLVWASSFKFGGPSNFRIKSQGQRSESQTLKSKFIMPTNPSHLIVIEEQKTVDQQIDSDCDILTR